MVLDAAGGGSDIQLTDVDPPLSDCETDDGSASTGGGGEDEKISILYGETEVLDEAASVEEDGHGGFDIDDIKTQLVDTCEAAAIEVDGVKTQLVDTCEEAAADLDSGKTQLADTYQETEAVVDDCSLGGSERTEVLSDDDGSIGGGTACGRTGHAEGTAVVVDSGLREQKEEDLVDSDASTDDNDGDAGSLRKSFTSVRVAAVRSSGLAAACYITSKKLGSDSKSFCNGIDRLNYENAAGGHMNSEGISLGNWKHNLNDLTSISSKTADIDVSRIPTQDFYKGGVQSRSSSARAKKLFDDVTPSKKAESTINTGLIAEQEDTLHLSGTDEVVAGLSYINSQEPGEFTQANALEVVDQFLLINDVESSEELKNIATNTMKCPVSCIKGVQLLAEKTERRSPVGKVGIFEWNDNREDEGGGDFFCKRKDSFFEGTSGAQKMKGHHSRVSHSVSAIDRGAFNKKQKTEDADPSERKKITIALSDSRLTMQHSPKFSVFHSSEAKTRKSLFKDMDEESNSKPSEHQLDATDAEEAMQDASDVGPNTQMAAEVLEGLFHGSPLKSKKKDKTPPSRTSIKKSCKVSATKEASLNSVLFPKRSSAGNSEGVITRSKRRKILPIETTNQNPKSCAYHSGNARSKNNKDKTTSEVRVKEKLKVGIQVDGDNAVSENVAKKSLEKTKEKGKADPPLLEEAEKYHGQIVSNVQVLARKQFTDRDLHSNSTPVASRTRQSKRVNLLKQPMTLLKGGGLDKIMLMDASTEGTIQKQSNLDADASGVTNAKIKISSKGLHSKEGNVKTGLTQHEVQNPERVHQGETKSGFQRNFFNPPKRKRTQITPVNRHLNNIGKGGDIVPKVDRNSKKVETKKVYIRSVTDIFDKAVRKRRSISARMLLEFDRLPSTSCAPMVSNVKTRSSLNQMDFNNSNECLTNLLSLQAESNMAANHLSNGEVNHTSDLEEVISCKSGANYNEITEHNDKLEGVKSDREIAAVSPVCLAKDPSRTPKKSSSATSLARELHRLETAVASSSPILKEVRRRKDMASIRVLFSQHLDVDTVRQQKKILARLGLKVATSISDATHFVADKFVRTQNMLEAIAVAKPVVTPMWLESCGQEHCFIDERNYILRDSKKEKEIGFSMSVSLASACQYPLLKNKRVYVTPNVKPSRQVIISLITATCGQAIERIGRSTLKQDKVPDDLLVISCDEDYSFCLPLLKKGAEVFSSELLLNGIVTQKLEYERHRLFLDHVKRTRSTLWIRPEEGGQLIPATSGV